jgi:hypothetical protein
MSIVCPARGQPRAGIAKHFEKNEQQREQIRASPSLYAAKTFDGAPVNPAILTCIERLAAVRERRTSRTGFFRRSLTFRFLVSPAVFSVS